MLVLVVVATLPEAARLAAAGAAATLVDAAAAAAATPDIPIMNGVVPVPAAAVLSLNLPLVPEDDTRSRPRSNLPAALVLALAEEPPCARGSSPSALLILLRFLMLLDIDVPFDFFILMLDIQRQRRCVLFHEYARTIPDGTLALFHQNKL